MDNGNYMIIKFLLQSTLITLKKYMEDAISSEIAFLYSQIKPHFLSNTLNMVISLCYIDGEKAAKILTSFSKYL